MPVEEDCNAETLANTLFTNLTTDVTTVPDIDFTAVKYEYAIDGGSFLHDDPANITLDDLTTVALTGTGVFDKLMRAVDLHFKREFEKGRITGDQYADAYSKAMGVVLGTSTQFLLSKDQARWQAIQAQMQARVVEVEAVKAMVELDKAKLDASRAAYDMKTSGAQYALTKINIANANQQYCLLVAQTEKERYTVDKIMPVTLAQEQYNLNYSLPLTSELASEQIEKERAQTLDTRRDGMTPTKGIIGQERQILATELETKKYNLKTVLPVTLAQEEYTLNYALPLQSELTSEQIEKERAQTLDTRRDGMTPTKGLLGQQRKILTTELDTKDYTLATMLPQQVAIGAIDLGSKQYQLDFMLPKQLAVISEQLETERAKTLDTRTDTVPVTGSIGKQKDLYTQQIDSFQKDAKYKVAKMYLDGWITQKTLDEGLLAPTELTNAEINEVLTTIRSNNSL